MTIAYAYRPGICKYTGVGGKRERVRDKQWKRCNEKVRESWKFEIEGLLNRQASETLGQRLVINSSSPKNDDSSL